jgi:hypothetical protein
MNEIPDTNHIKRNVFKFRDYFWHIAQKTYPFTEVNQEGKKVYLDKAFEHRYSVCEQELGRMPNMKCTRIFIWQEILRLWTAIMFWAVATLIDYFFGFPWSLILPIFLIVMLALQEFVVDTMRYHQPWLRGLIDWIVWVIPLILFILIQVI